MTYNPLTREGDVEGDVPQSEGDVRFPHTERRTAAVWASPKTSGARPSLAYQAISFLRWSAVGFRH